MSNMEERLYYVTDTYGTYYTINASNRLVPTNEKEQASKFTLGKANSVIQTMIKPMQRYQYIIREVESEKTETTVQENSVQYMDVKEEDCFETMFDMTDMDWINYIQTLIIFCSDLKQYRVNLNYLLSQVDKEICDIMHYIEFNNLDAANGYKMYKMLKDCRLRRRKIKDDLEKINMIIPALADKELKEKLKTCLSQMKGLEHRKYAPRVLSELFEEAS